MGRKNPYIEVRRKRNGTTYVNTVAFQRKSQGLTQQQLGEIVGLSKKTISLIELGHTSPNVYDAQRIAIALGFSTIGAAVLFWEERD